MWADKKINTKLYNKFNAKILNIIKLTLYFRVNFNKINYINKLHAIRLGRLLTMSFLSQFFFTFFLNHIFSLFLFLITKYCYSDDNGSDDYQYDNDYL